MRIINFRVGGLIYSFYFAAQHSMGGTLPTATQAIVAITVSNEYWSHPPNSAWVLARYRRY